MDIKENSIFQLVHRAIGEVVSCNTIVPAGIWQADDKYMDYKMKVRYNVVLEMKMVDTKAELAEVTDCDVDWSEMHFLERIGKRPLNPGASYKIWPYNNFVDGDPYMMGKSFSHTYMERFWPKFAGTLTDEEMLSEEYWDLMTQNQGIHFQLGNLDDVITQLKENPLTRQAYLPIFFPEDTGAVHKERVPCTLGYYFYIREDKLYCNYIIRSCDVFRHFRNDVYLTGRLQQHVAKRLGKQVGDLTMYIFNLHAFENDVYNINKRESKIWKESAE